MASNEVVDTSGWEKYFLKVLAESDKPVEAQIITNDSEVESYIHVLEKGSRAGARPWPSAKKKTVRRGDRIFSRQAPKGFVEVNADRFREFLRDAYVKRVRELKRPLTRAELVSAANEAAEKALVLEQKAIPVDSGKAENSLEVRKAK